jgi:nitrite reductase/ring-hydroxylating ferredoxin subunit
MDERIHQLELENLFPRAWLFVGHASQAPRPGDFFSSWMGSDPVLLTRDDQGELHVLLNSCRHRGMRVCRYGEGNTMQFTCPYHAWSYSIDGSLVSTPGDLHGVPQLKAAYNGTETRAFGDLGPRLGAALVSADETGRLPAPVLPADARIRATALGASEYTVQLSGITSYLGSPERTLPRRNLPVARPQYEIPDVIDATAAGEEIRRHIARFGVGAADLVVALRWEGPPEYYRLRGLAEAVAQGLADRIAAGAPLYLMLDGDVARTLGLLLREELGITNDLVIDGVLLRDFDYVDLGRVRQPSGMVPVTIKSLVFGHQVSDAEPDLTAPLLPCRTVIYR